MYIHATTGCRAKAALPALPCACASLRRAARSVTQLYDRELRGAGLNAPQFTLLQALAVAGPIGHGHLARLLALDSSTLSRTLRPLEGERWIRCDRGKDRRERQVSLTKAGRSQLDQAASAWERAQRRLRARLGAHYWRTLASGLAAVAGLARTA